jgi:hypothetical protein
MPGQGSIADQLTGWEKLVTNVDADEAELPDLSAYRDPLRDILEEGKARNARIQFLIGTKQQEVKDLREDLRTGRFYAAKLRASLKAHYGYQSERLRKYGIRPVSTRKRPPGESEEPAPPEVPEIEAAPETAEAPKPEGPATAPPNKPGF